MKAGLVLQHRRSNDARNVDEFGAPPKARARVTHLMIHGGYARGRLVRSNTLPA
jgi:hypothetical protein